jgi:hypothetical protein
MEEIIFGSVILWALGRVVKKKADAPAPGTIAPPPQQRMGPGSTANRKPVGPNDTGAAGGGRPGML